MDTERILRAITEQAVAVVARRRDLDPVRLGTISDLRQDGPIVLLDGETIPASRPYRRLDSYAPAIGDRVLLIRAGRSWIIAGKIV